MVKSAGTFHFFSPECCDTEVETYSGRATDIWALGVTMYCMLFNSLPFWDPEVNEYGILDIILKSEVKIPENSNRNTELDSRLLGLMFKLLDKNPRTRITATQLVAELATFD